MSRWATADLALRSRGSVCTVDSKSYSSMRSGRSHLLAVREQQQHCDEGQGSTCADCCLASGSQAHHPLSRQIPAGSLVQASRRAVITSSQRSLCRQARAEPRICLEAQLSKSDLDCAQPLRVRQSMLHNKAPLDPGSWRANRQTGIRRWLHP